MTPNVPPLSKMEIILILMLLGMTFLAFYLFESLPSSETKSATNNDAKIIPDFVPGVSNANSGTATSGKLFSGDKIRTYSGDNYFDKISDLEKIYEKYSGVKSQVNSSGSLQCDHWGVVTTIFEPSDAVRKQVGVPGWCLVVVGDRKGPLSYGIDAPLQNFVFLTAAQQEAMNNIFPVVKALPWNHFGRKNVGYLYAILHGAKVIWDFDDDNIMIDKSFHASLLGPTDSTSNTSFFSALEPENYDSLVLNPYPIMGANVFPVWPRGFPLERIVSNSSSSSRPIPTSVVEVDSAAVGIIQSLANHDPDVDAIYRLTMPLPFDFPRRGNTSPLMVPIGSYAPYNAQATLHKYSSLWSLLLPVTVHGRVSDIWRGYFAQVSLFIMESD